MPPDQPSAPKGTLPNPADAFFKEAFSHLPTCRSLLEQFAPGVLTRRTDWKTLKREPESFLDANLRSRYADLLFSCRIAGHKAFYYVLLEHKSAPEFWTAFHLLELMARIWRKHLDNVRYARTRLPLIIPLVLHQGPKSWKHSSRFADYVHWPEDGREELQKLIPNFQHLLIDLSKIPFDQIKGKARYRLALSLMKAVRNRRLPEILLKLAPLLLRLGNAESTRHFIESFCRYLLETNQPLNISTIHTLADKLPDESKSQLMTLAQRLFDEGRDEGRQEGLLFGELNTCREILGLPVLSPEQWEQKPLAELKKELRQMKIQVAQRIRS